MIDLEARNSYPNGSSASATKDATRFNMNGTIDCLTNTNKEDLSCPRCCETEDLEHVIQCNSANEIKKVHLNRLKYLLIKAEVANEYRSKIE